MSSSFVYLRFLKKNLNKKIITWMIDFRQLVLEEIEKAPLRAYYDDPVQLPNVRSVLKAKYNIDKFPNSQTTFGHAKEAFERSNASQLKELLMYFPLVDFLFFVAEKEDSKVKRGEGTAVLGGSTQISKENMQTYDQEFATNFNKVNKDVLNNSNPIFNYTPSSGKGSSLLLVLKNNLANETVGNLTINSSNFSVLSIKQAIYALVKARQKTEAKTINTAALPNDIKYVSSILLNPVAYAGGQTKIPADLTKYYSNLDAAILIELGEAINNFYNSELKRLELITQKIITTKAEFIDNKLDTKSGSFGFINIPTGLSAPITKLAEPKPGKGGYNIANIIQLTESEEAKTLINLLTRFANFVKTAEPKNWKDVSSGVQGIASNISKMGGDVMR